MATKSEKKARKKHSEQMKETQELLGKRDANTITTLENFCTYQVLYVNDNALNNILSLGQEMQKIGYKSKIYYKLYAAMKKRIERYFEIVNKSDVDFYAIAALFERIDELMEPKILQLRNAIEKLLIEKGVEHPNWVARVETAELMLTFAVAVSNGISHEMAKYSDNADLLRNTLPSDLTNIMERFCNVVSEAEHIKEEINLNSSDEIVNATSEITDTFFNTRKFKEILDDTKKECTENNYQLFL